MFLKYLKEYRDFRKKRKVENYFELMRNENSIFSVLVQCMQREVITPNQFDIIHNMYDNVNTSKANFDLNIHIPKALENKTISELMNKLINIDNERKSKNNGKKK